ncbi:MAG TPA: YggT family protein [Anaerolineales bacterium]|nr:YggT family protein [Anaerolineales bacterium]HNA89282.1 YggT family protein [Anaerolineales bacterium]HNB36779.1 YggT family protein [Anaerolineales bacterium]
MDTNFIVLFIRVVEQIFIWVVIANSLLSFVLAPNHPVREALERIVAPFLNPIRNIMPNTGAIDFSPLVLILAVEVITQILITLLLS